MQDLELELETKLATTAATSQQQIDALVNQHQLVVQVHRDHLPVRNASVLSRVLNNISVVIECSHVTLRDLTSSLH